MFVIVTLLRPASCIKRKVYWGGKRFCGTLGGGLGGYLGEAVDRLTVKD